VTVKPSYFFYVHAPRFFLFRLLLLSLSCKSGVMAGIISVKLIALAN
jgi:hypothetical protein